MVVDWLRSCYSSRWRLFAGSEQETAGRYYWSPPGSLHYPGVHNYGSATWHRTDPETVQGSLGEVIGTPRKHYSGVYDSQYPEQVVAGSPECIRNGEMPGDVLDPTNSYAGYPVECYVPPAAPPPDAARLDYEKASAFSRCALARLWATVIEFMYLDDAASIQALLAAFLPSNPTVTVHSALGDMPSVTTVVHADYCCVAIDGTRNAQELALQAFQGVNPPQNFGILSTLPLWYTAATYVATKLLADGVNDQRPIFLTGHSYGAAVAAILAARYRNGGPTRSVKYLTFGCPKVGDDRLAALLDRCDGASLANDNDLVTTLPPDRATMAPVIVLFPFFAFGPWFDWERPPATSTQYGDGTLTAGANVLLDFQTLFNMVSHVVAGTPQTTIIGHSISEYLRRLALRCPEALWPVDAEVEELLSEETESEGGIAISGGTATWTGGGLIRIGGGTVPPVVNGGILIGGGTVPPVVNGGILIGE
jgi:pimeloyl-ACP methyl ester carboxylesterase